MSERDPATEPAPYAIEIEYENADRNPDSVDGVQGIWTPRGVFHIQFYVERIKTVTRMTPERVLTGPVEPRTGGHASRPVSYQEPTAFDVSEEKATLVRHVVASMNIREDVFRNIVGWMQSQLEARQRVQSESDDVS